MAYGGDLQANTAVDLMVGPFLDSTDGDTEETGLTITQAEVRLSKNGANIAQKNEATSLTHDELGNYLCKLNTTDTNTEGILTLMIHESGALSIKMDYTVMAQAAYISKYTAKDTGFMDVDVKAVSGDTTAADNLEAILDGNGITADVDLTARSLTITNDAGVGLAVTGTTDAITATGTAGSGIKATSSGSNGHGIEIAGNGSGDGVQTVGGTTGHGVDMQGGASGGQGLNIKANAGNASGILSVGNGSGYGLDARGGTTGHGIAGLGGASGGAGIYGQAQANNDAGMELVKHGTGDDLDADTIATDTPAILTDTNEIQGKLPSNKFMGSSDGADDDGTLNTIATDAARLTAARAGALTDWIDGGRLDLILDIIAADTTTDIPALIATAQSDLDTITGGSGVLIDTDAVDADSLKADAITEIWAKAMVDLAQGAPSATASVLVAINHLYEAWRNKTETTATRLTVYKNDAATELVRSTISDDATTFTKGEMVTGV